MAEYLMECNICGDQLRSEDGEAAAQWWRAHEHKERGDGN